MESCSIEEICTKKKGRLGKMNTLNKQPASLPVFVDVLFWEPQTHTQKQFHHHLRFDNRVKLREIDVKALENHILPLQIKGS